MVLDTHESHDILNNISHVVAVCLSDRKYNRKSFRSDFGVSGSEMVMLNSLQKVHNVFDFPYLLSMIQMNNSLIRA